MHSSNLYMSITIYNKKRITQSANQFLNLAGLIVWGTCRQKMLNYYMLKFWIVVVTDCFVVVQPIKKENRQLLVVIKEPHPILLYKGSSLIIQEEVNWYIRVLLHSGLGHMKWFDDGTSLPRVSALFFYIFLLQERNSQICKTFDPTSAESSNLPAAAHIIYPHSIYHANILFPHVLYRIALMKRNLGGSVMFSSLPGAQFRRLIYQRIIRWYDDRRPKNEPIYRSYICCCWSI